MADLIEIEGYDVPATNNPVDIDDINRTITNDLVCDSQNRIRVNHIIDKANNNALRITNVANEFHRYTKGTNHTIRTRLVGNVLYMTDDGTAP